MWTLAYKDYYNRYFNKAIGENYYTPRLLYIDKSCWEIDLIALICAYDTPTVNTFLNNLGIKDISDITISFQIDEERREMFKKHDALRWFNRVTPDGTSNINAKTLATTDTNPTSALAQKESKSKLVFQYLYLLSQPERKKGEPNRVQKLINSIDKKMDTKESKTPQMPIQKKPQMWDLEVTLLDRQEILAAFEEEELK